MMHFLNDATDGRALALRARMGALWLVMLAFGATQAYAQAPTPPVDGSGDSASTASTASTAVTAQVTDEPSTGPVEAPNAGPTLPELPDTVVPGKLGSSGTPATAFPLEPLNENTVISPNRVGSSAAQTASSLTVITAEQIERSGQKTVSEVLRGTLGVDVVQQGSQGGVTSVFLRGANSQHTKVLLDGIPLNDPSNASRLFDFSNLTTDNIQRIEVLRGPQSMAYGSDAIGGVINIITKRGEGPLGVRVSGLGGSFGTAQTGLNLSGGDQQKYYSFSASLLNTGGISAASSRNGNREKDPYNNGTFSGRFGYNLNENWNIDYVFRYVDATAHVDDFDFFSGLPVDNLIRKNLTKNFSNRVQVSNNSFDGQLLQKVGFSLNDVDRNDTDPGPFTPPNFHGQTREVDYTASAILTENNTLTGGANYLAESASSSFDPLASQNVKGVFLQDGIQIGKNWYSTAGARWDETSRAGTAQTYRVTSLYNIEATSSTLHGTIGTGFRQPALAENLFAFGNPNLRPERSKGWDVGMKQQIVENFLWFDATYFRNDFVDLIVFDFNTFSLENVGRSRSTGVELIGTCNLDEQNIVNASYTHDDTLNLDTGTWLLRRPRDKFTVSYTHLWPDKRASTTVQMLYVGQRFDTGATYLGDYAILNMSGRYQATQQLELSAARQHHRYEVSAGPRLRDLRLWSLWWA